MTDVFHPERVAELTKTHDPRQTGGDAVGINADDPLAILNLLAERGPVWIKALGEEAEDLERQARERRALAQRVVQAMQGGKA